MSESKFDKAKAHIRGFKYHLNAYPQHVDDATRLLLDYAEFLVLAIEGPTGFLAQEEKMNDYINSLERQLSNENEINEESNHTQAIEIMALEKKIKNLKAWITKTERNADYHADKNDELMKRVDDLGNALRLIAEHPDPDFPMENLKDELRRAEQTYYWMREVAKATLNNEEWYFTG